MNKKNTRKGFTTVELVVVIAVIAILATVLIPTFDGLIDDARESAALINAKNSYIQHMNDNAATGIIVSDGYITSGDYTFQVVGGQIQDEPVTIPSDSTAFINIG